MIIASLLSLLSLCLSCYHLLQWHAQVGLLINAYEATYINYKYPQGNTKENVPKRLRLGNTPFCANPTSKWLANPAKKVNRIPSVKLIQIFRGGRRGGGGGGEALY